MMNGVRRVSRWLAGPAAVLAGLSTHGLGAVIVLALLAAWIIGSDARAARLTRIISAWRGDAGALSSDASSAASAAAQTAGRPPSQQLSQPKRGRPPAPTGGRRNG